MSRPHDPSLCDVMVMEFVESDVGLRGTAVMMGSAVAPESQSEFPERDTERDMQTRHGYAMTKPPAARSRGRR